MMSGKPLRDAAPLVGLLCIFAGLTMLVAYCGCSEPKVPLPAYCTNREAFTARLLACVDEAARESSNEREFRNKSRICRSAAHERCGITYASADDGGSP